MWPKPPPDPRRNQELNGFGGAEATPPAEEGSGGAAGVGEVVRGVDEAGVGEVVLELGDLGVGAGRREGVQHDGVLLSSTGDVPASATITKHGNYCRHGILLPYQRSVPRQNEELMG